MLLSTDLSLSEEEIVALYGKRWDIEVFFKVIKSYLRLTKEFQMRSFDAMTAHMVIVLTRYMLLSLESRQNKDDRSIGEIFYISCNELEDISFAFAFELLIKILKQNLADFVHLSKAQINAFIDQ